MIMVDSLASGGPFSYFVVGGIFLACNYLRKY